LMYNYLLLYGVSFHSILWQNTVLLLKLTHQCIFLTLLWKKSLQFFK
jgi:hypothetical protein